MVTASASRDRLGSWPSFTFLHFLFQPVLTTPISPQVSSAIASVEDALGLPSPEDLAEGKDVNTEEVSKQADGKLILTAVIHKSYPLYETILL
jgi:hypothetical protein